MRRHAEVDAELRKHGAASHLKLCSECCGPHRSKSVLVQLPSLSTKFTVHNCALCIMAACGLMTKAYSRRRRSLVNIPENRWSPERFRRPAVNRKKWLKTGTGYRLSGAQKDDPGTRCRFDRLIQESLTSILLHVRADSPALAGEQNQSLLPSLSRKLPT